MPPTLVGQPRVHQLHTWRESTYFFFSLLWKAEVAIPDALFLNDRWAVDAWLFTSKRGAVLRRNSDKVSALRFHETLQRRAAEGDFVALRRNETNALLDADESLDVATMLDMLQHSNTESRGDRYCLLEYIPPTSDTRFVVKFQRESYVPQAAYTMTCRSKRHSVFYGTAWDDGTSAINRRLTDGVRDQLKSLVRTAVDHVESQHNLVVVDLFAEAVEHKVKGTLVLTGIRRLRCIVSDHSSLHAAELIALPSTADPGPPQAPEVSTDFSALSDWSSGDERTSSRRLRPLSASSRPGSAVRSRPGSAATSRRRPGSSPGRRSPPRGRPGSSPPRGRPGSSPGRRRPGSPARGGRPLSPSGFATTSMRRSLSPAEHRSLSPEAREREFRITSVYPADISETRPRPMSASLGYRRIESGPLSGEEMEMGTWVQENIVHSRPASVAFHNGSSLEVQLHQIKGKCSSPTHFAGPQHLSVQHAYLDDAAEVEGLSQPNAVEARALEEIESLNGKYNDIMAELKRMEELHAVDISQIAQVEAENNRLHRRVSEVRSRFDMQSLSLTEQRNNLKQELKSAEAEGDATIQKLDSERWALHQAQEKLTEVKHAATVAERARDDLRRTVASAQDPEMVKVRDEAERLANAVNKSAADGEKIKDELSSLELELESSKKELMRELTFRAHTYKLLADTTQPGVEPPSKASAFPRPRPANVQRAVLGLLDGQYRSVSRRGAIFKNPAQARALRSLLASSFITSYPMIEREQPETEEDDSDDSSSEEDEEYVLRRGSGGPPRRSSGSGGQEEAKD